jgi:hypothetical protein
MPGKLRAGAVKERLAGYAVKGNLAHRLFRRGRPPVSFSSV